MASQQFFYIWMEFKTKKEISRRPFVGSSASKDKYSKISSVSFLKQREQEITASLFNISQ